MSEPPPPPHTPRPDHAGQSGGRTRTPTTTDTGLTIAVIAVPPTLTHLPSVRSWRAKRLVKPECDYRAHGAALGLKLQLVWAVLDFQTKVFLSTFPSLHTLPPPSPVVPPTLPPLLHLLSSSLIARPSLPLTAALVILHLVSISFVSPCPSRPSCLLFSLHLLAPTSLHSPPSRRTISASSHLPSTLPFSSRLPSPPPHSLPTFPLLSLPPFLPPPPFPSLVSSCLSRYPPHLRCLPFPLLDYLRRHNSLPPSPTLESDRDSRQDG
ncbi:hypothetical protein DFH08DRAFT_73229 [Mycena albidolilacea]|uniref:Uncharacterized protein n=1 Tax=Mycena albidolilacea TaxID=1033008 RepID=A0AAD6YZR2_9AGAR|nr:hypothetical protein DFH08DRAFT_73229 [Mycena albidolilacea]